MALHARSEYYALTGLKRRQVEKKPGLSPLASFELSSLAMFIAIFLWVAGLTWFAVMVFKTL